MRTMKPIRTMLRPLIVLLVLFGTAPRASATEDPKPIRVDQENLAKLSPADQARVLAIVDRLETITAMDRSELTRAERKDLRHETRELREEAKAFNSRAGGTVIYISASTLIIILLLIIIFA